MKKERWIVSWRWNGKLYTESFDTLMQAQLKYWKLNDPEAGIHKVF